MDVIGYSRVSTAEQADSGLGLQAQRDAIQNAVDGRLWRLVGFHEDAGLSGKSANRPGLNQAIHDVEAGKAGALVVAKLDRLSRSLKDFTTLMDRSLAKGWAVVALDVGVDTTTPNGELVANVMATFAQFERRIIGQRTKDALAVKREQGVKLGRPVVVSDDFARELLEKRTAGMTYSAIAEDLNERSIPTAHGGACWYPATVRSLILRCS